ncbi:MAG: site-specific integrase [Thermodesulfobacteriota bacterium]|nr:site-specific integrase [Thermodesulfobacteriota bacterium]
MGVKVREKVKGSGEWWVFINHQGRRKSKRVGSEDLALEVAKKIEARLTLGDLDLEKKEPVPCPTFGEYSEHWLKFIETLRRQGTHERYETVLRLHVNPVIGKKRLDHIKRGDIRNLLLDKTRGGSRSLVRLTRDVISGVYQHAMDEELVQASPVTGITKRFQLNRKKRPPIEPLTREELALFLETCREPFLIMHYPLFLMAARTGMRLGELLAVQWGDIDFNSRFVWVRRSYRRGRVTSTKTGKERRVDMSDQLAEELKRLLKQRKKEALQQGLGHVRDLVFHRDGGRIIEQNYIRRVFKRILAKAELREIRLHDLRHTFASLLLSQGESPVYVKEQLGHSSIQITVDVYGHLIPGSNRGAVNKLDDAPTCTPYAPTNKKGGITACIH